MAPTHCAGLLFDPLVHEKRIESSFSGGGSVCERERGAGRAGLRSAYVYKSYRAKVGAALIFIFEEGKPSGLARLFVSNKIDIGRLAKLREYGNHISL